MVDARTIFINCHAATVLAIMQLFLLLYYCCSLLATIVAGMSQNTSSVIDLPPCVSPIELSIHIRLEDGESRVILFLITFTLSAQHQRS